MADQFVTVDYCDCEHLKATHGSRAVTDDDGRVRTYHICTQPKCGCIQYRHKYTLGYTGVVEIPIDPDA
jgi:hypothetical protein